MLGISVYLSKQFDDDLETYVNKMNQIGCKSIFTSLHIPEDDHSLYEDRLKFLGKLSQKYEMELFADISPQSLHHLGFTWENAHELQAWGVTGLRVDYGISERRIAELSRKTRIALNASTLTKESLATLKNFGLQVSSVEAWHNFYPRPETGLNEWEFSIKNHWLRLEGVKVMAFIPGDGKLRGPLFCGLPTVESHRGHSTFASFLDFENNQSIDKMIIGDPSINKDSYEKFKFYLENDVICLRAESFIKNKEIKERLHSIQTNRLDAARDVIRSAESRLDNVLGNMEIAPENTVERLYGSITIDNCKYGRYQGEIQITKTDLPADEKVNVVGRVVAEDRVLIHYIKGGKKFRIQWVD